MYMKNMKTMSFLRNLSKFFLVATTLTLGCMPAFSEFTKVRSDGGWNGKVTKLDVIGDYYQFTLDKFRGEIVIETDIEADTIYLPNYNNTKGWVLEDDKAVKVQINNETSGFLCVSYDRPTNSVSVAYGSCSGTIYADKDRVCKTTGGDVKFKVENGDASASKRWGLLSYDGKDTTWLSTYDDRDSFVYTVTDSIVMLLKYTTSSGLVSYSPQRWACLWRIAAIRSLPALRIFARVTLWFLLPTIRRVLLMSGDVITGRCSPQPLSLLFR